MGITFDSVSQSLKEALITPEHRQVTIRTVRAGMILVGYWLRSDCRKD